MFNDLANQAAIISGLASGQLVNTAGPVTLQQAYGAALTSDSSLPREAFRSAPRLRVEVDKVTNGFVLAVGAERMIAKDLEELQGLFISQVAAMLLEDN